MFYGPTWLDSYSYLSLLRNHIPFHSSSSVFKDLFLSPLIQFLQVHSTSSLGSESGIGSVSLSWCRHGLSPEPTRLRPNCEANPLNHQVGPIPEVQMLKITVPLFISPWLNSSSLGVGFHMWFESGSLMYYKITISNYDNLPVLSSSLQGPERGKRSVKSNRVSWPFGKWHHTL